MKGLPLWERRRRLLAAFLLLWSLAVLVRLIYLAGPGRSARLPERERMIRIAPERGR